MHDERLDPRRLEGHARRSQGPARAAGPARSTRSSPSRSTRHCNRDAVESKLFGIGSESYVVGSHEFYLGYALTRKKLLCLDAGHFHPTEVISDKISAVLTLARRDPAPRQPRSALGQRPRGHAHDELQAIAQEIVRGDYLDRVHIGLDFFDASINRVAAWVIGTRSMLKALLLALLEPTDRSCELEEAEGDLTGAAGDSRRVRSRSRRARSGTTTVSRQDVPVGHRLAGGGHGPTKRDVLSCAGGI